MTPPATSQSTSQEKRTRRFCFPMRPLSTMNRRPNQSKIMIFSLCYYIVSCQYIVSRQYVVSRQNIVSRQQSLIRDANSEQALTDLRLFLYVKERPEVTILSWGKRRKDLTYTPKIAGLLPYFDTNSSTHYNFLGPLQFSQPRT